MEMPGDSDDPVGLGDGSVLDDVLLIVPRIEEVENIPNVVGRSDDPTELLGDSPFGVDDEESEAVEGDADGSVP